MRWNTRFLALAAATITALVLGPAVAPAAVYRACDPVVDPYPDTRYEGVDLTRIRVLRDSCQKARRVARKAHDKALGMTPSRNGIRRFRWDGWRVRGDLRPANDRYVARKGTRRVCWRF